MNDKLQIVNLTTESFSKEISSGIAVVDFWAEWCGPCNTQGKILTELAYEIGDKVLIAKLDVDENRNIALKYGIRSIPTLLIFKNGNVVKQLIGVTGKKEIIEIINKL